MNTRTLSRLDAAALLAATFGLLFSASNSLAEEKSAPPAAAAAASNSVPLSVFVVPSNSSEGRDPFFPKSERPWRRVTTVVSTNVHPVQPSSEVAYIAFTGTPDHRLATMTINGIGRTLAVGESTTITSRGSQIEVRCIEITEEKVVVEINGEARVVPFRSK